MMKFICLIFLLFIVIAASGCLTYKTYEVTAIFNDDFSLAEITATYTDVRSSEKDPDKQRGDFEELIKKYQEDSFLVEKAGGGIYVKERRIYEKDGILNAGYSGVFKRESLLKVNEDEQYVLIDIDIEPDDIITSNGKVLRSKRTALLVWPKDMKKISYKVTKSNNQPTYSLLQFYKNWLEK